MSHCSFPPAFLWGVATSAYQIEGATRDEGRGESIWDRFSKAPGRISDGTNGDVACDHYRRWKCDIDLLKELGLSAYRFSIAWPRVCPAGRGLVNQAGIDFYSRLVDALLEAGVEPCPTLFHWDLPQCLEDEGGWAVRSTAEAFATYVEEVAKVLGDRVETWMTHNEPWCAAFLGYHHGVHAPGSQNLRRAIAASHHLLLSHGWAVPIIRSESAKAEVGAVLNLVALSPATNSESDRNACRRSDGQANRWFLDPLYGRGYPEDTVRHYADQGHLSGGFTEVLPGDLEVIAVPTDFLGVNYYTRELVRAEDGDAGTAGQVSGEDTVERTDMDWEVYPDGLVEILCRVSDEYGPRKIYVTENGAAYDTGPDSEGRVADQARIEFLRRHFLAAHRCIEGGVPLEGYFVWSLLDNFEWSHGYTKRFGLVWVDFESQERCFKDSARWYQGVIRENGLPVA